MSACRSCGADITWAVTSNGKRIPLNRHPDPTGNLAYRDDGRIVNAHGFPPDTARYIAHFATCPNATAHRHGS